MFSTLAGMKNAVAAAWHRICFYLFGWDKKDPASNAQSVCQVDASADLFRLMGGADQVYTVRKQAHDLAACATKKKGR